MVEFLSIKGHMKLMIDRVLNTDDVALLFSSWTLRGTSADGTPVVSSGQTSDVVRRQADGSAGLFRNRQSPRSAPPRK